MAKTAREQGYEVTIAAVSQARARDIAEADLVLVGTWVEGFILFGTKPAKATLWVPALPSLHGKSVAIFCTYLFHPRGSLNTLQTMLEGRGATVLAQAAFRRNRAVESAPDFVRHVLTTVQPAQAAGA
jgi:hypothetical protein